MKGILTAFALILALCSCSDQEDAMPAVGTTRIEDPRASTVSDILAYIEAATRTGSMQVEVNGHTWSFHHGTAIEEGIQPKSKIEINDISELPNVINWIEENKENLILYYPNPSAPASTFWAVIDELEKKRTLYGTSRSEPEGLLRLEAYQTRSNRVDGSINSPVPHITPDSLRSLPSGGTASGHTGP